jgi:Family of unknown function (DUF6879)
VDRILTEDEAAEQLRSFEHTAFRLEQQRAYIVAVESEMFSRFLAGDLTPPTDTPAVREWFAQVGRQVDEGKRIERVRVQDEPQTPYQRWQRWFDRWNNEAGESIRYIARQRAQEIGLLPAAGDEDWWLFDSCRLMVMRYDDEGHLLETGLSTDPERVVQACAWRDLAVHHSTPAAAQGQAA